MQPLIELLQVQSLKEACINKLQELILSGKLKIGQMLPPERRLAEQLGVSRPRSWFTICLTKSCLAI